jgi:regulation of enolase protein 1 (concanavalin A-like superfamily)
MSKTSRRGFLQQSAMVSCAAMLGGSVRALGTQASPEADLLGRMTWMNDPASWKKDGDRIVVRSKAKTDFWRKTFYGYVTDNGHFFHAPVSGDFVFEARVNGQYAALYDQAGLMVRRDAENWMKCGTEFFDNARHASVVFTREFSDWSTMKDLSDSAPVWWRAVRKKDSIETLCSADGKNFVSVRQGYFVTTPEVQVGIMCAAPEGAGFEAVFDQLKLKLG